jgi:TonB family protein
MKRIAAIAILLVACHRDRIVAEDAGSPLVIALEGETTSVDGRRIPFEDIRKAITAPRDVVVDAPADTSWGRVVQALDLAKQGGCKDVALPVHGDAARRTQTIPLPKASSSAGGLFGDRIIRTVTVVADGTLFVDGKAGALPIEASKDMVVVIRADQQSQLGVVVDVTRSAQRTGAQIAFSVLPGPPPLAPPPAPSATATGRPILRGKIEACDFPREADTASIDDAIVSVALTVDAAGKVTDVSIVKDPGHGFGDAAKPCARKMTFEPGHPGSLVMKIHFTR